MTAIYDAIVIGLGVMGSATVRALAGRCRVLGLERFVSPHAIGSSHGRTRIIREAYFEHPLYVPLVRRAYELWDQLERDSDRVLFRRTGALAIGPADGALITGTRKSAVAHGIPHQDLSAAEVRAKWPLLEPPADSIGLLEHRAGLLFPEACVAAFLEQAAAQGAALQMDEMVTGWEPDAHGVRVRTGGGTYFGRTLIVAAGSWATGLLGALSLPLAIERQVSFWFAAAGDAASLTAQRCPVVLWEPAPERLFYLTPDVGDGVKAALHHEGESTRPDAVRPPDADDEEAVRGLLQRLLPAANGPRLEARTCLYTNTPDRNFVIDRHPDHPQVLIASPCSGHGFKFAPVIGEILAELATAGVSRFDLLPFALGRLL